MRSEELEGAYSAVASCKSQVARSVAFGNVIGHLAFGIGDRALALHTGLRSRLHSIALRSNALTSKIQNLPSSIKKTRFLIPHSSFLTLPRKGES